MNMKLHPKYTMKAKLNSPSLFVKVFIFFFFIILLLHPTEQLRRAEDLNKALDNF